MSSALTERRRSTPAPKEEEKVNEEQWPLREVVFVEDVKNVPVGKVGVATGRDHTLMLSGRLGDRHHCFDFINTKIFRLSHLIVISKTFWSIFQSNFFISVFIYM